MEDGCGEPRVEDYHKPPRANRRPSRPDLHRMARVEGGAKDESSLAGPDCALVLLPVTPSSHPHWLTRCSCLPLRMRSSHPVSQFLHLPAIPTQSSRELRACISPSPHTGAPNMCLPLVSCQKRSLPFAIPVTCTATPVANLVSASFEHSEAYPAHPNSCLPALSSKVSLHTKREG